MVFKAGVVGAAGFAGVELVRRIIEHPSFELSIITSDSDAGQSLASVYPAFAGVTDIAFSRHDDPALEGLDVAFLAVPHTASLAVTPRLIAAGVTVIDLSADYRLKDPAIYEKWYGVPHTSTELLAQAAFGLPELAAGELQQAAQLHAQGKAALVACAGCYPTASSLAAFPAV
ncbi:MAG: N-acetyl-gamma-glutamyl-phosphate reductase, partial [Eggerthellaceae bacterium]|nr:N-acetyl-gamma-glutamyl-phosphate reductase [Eggerthellaceae bacterium]